MIRHFGLPTVLILALGCFVPSQAQSQNLLKNLERSIEKALTPRGGQIEPETIIGGAAGALLGAKIAGEFDTNGLVGAVVGTAVGAYVGNKIGKALNEQQRNRAASATVSTVVSGEQSSWNDAGSSTSGTVKVLKSENVSQPVAVQVDKSKVEEVPPLYLIGESYRVVTGSNVRGGPSTEFAKVGGLSAGSQVTVVGKVKEEPWYFISQDGIGSGFVYETLLEPSAASIVTEKPEIDAAADVYSVEVAESQLCRTVEQAVTLDDGTTTTETLTACKGANGWEIQEPGTAAG